MKDNLWKLVILTMLVSGLAMLLAGCGPEEEMTPTPVPVKPTATPVPAAPPTDTPVLSPALSPALSEVEGESEGPVPPPAEAGEASGLIDDFEGGDFDDRWWFYTDEGTVSFTCTSDQPGHASAQGMRLTFEVGASGYPGCGIDVDAGQWGDTGGLSFSWRADQPGLTAIVILEMEDPTQTHPEAEGVTPFQVVLQTPGEEWTPVTLEWDDFAKAEWVGEGGVDALDPTRVVALLFQAGEAQSGSVWFDDLQLMTGLEIAMPVPTVPPTDTAPSPYAGLVIDKWALWTGGTKLRGANIWQRMVVPEVDGDEFLGSGYVGPPYTQADFDRLAALGANYVNISGPGLFTEKPPYVVDEKVQAHLDNLLDMIAQADMFAVITARTGPGRSDFTFYDEGIEEWGDPSLVIDDIWLDQAAQDAWVEMWRYTAERYRDNTIVVGYDLMCEPNAAGRLLEIWNGEEFYPAYAGTLYDWNQLYLRITAAIREVDPNTPILVSAMGWGAVRWLPYLEPTVDPHTVYMVHQYEPQEDYTHQEPSGQNTYPGEFDLNWDGAPDPFNRDWLDEYFSAIDAFKAEHGVPVAVNEFGVHRWVPDGAAFMDDQMDLFEQRGMNHALWEWQPSWKPLTEENHAFNFRLGPNPDNRADVASSDLMDVIVKYWGRNTIRPSNLTTVASVSAAPSTGTPVPAGGDWWKPAVNTTWQWQLDQPIDQSFDVDMYDIDLFDSDASVVAALHAQGRQVVCYISVGSWEDWRPDKDQFPASVIGKDYEGWAGEKWLDIRQIDLLAPIMRARLDECKAKGFDGIEPDNIDGYTNNTGFPLTYEDQLKYNIWLANEAHARGLSIGLKNDPDQVADLLPYFDWALTEDCFAEGWCEEVLPFITAGKPVLAAEYTDMTTDQFCPQANAMNFGAILKNRDLGAYREACR